MISLLFGGDTDILREATKPNAVFWFRAKRNPLLVAIAAAATLIVLLLTALLFVEAYRLGVAIAYAPVVIGWMIYLGWLAFKFMPGRNDRIVMSLRSWVRTKVDPLEELTQALSDDQLRAKRGEFEKRLAEGESLDEIRPEVYACVREASRRARAHRQFECQLIGGKVIEDCNVAEMRTGEGKTIVCYVGNYMKILQGIKVHMVTVNDYLVKRDAEFCKPIFELLGASVGYISAEMETYGPGAQARREAYACDITYGTNSEFGFDYLRDNMKTRATDQVQGELGFTVVDEVDSILIDEARTPLIISGQAHGDITNYQRAEQLARSLIRKQEQEIRNTAGRIDDLERNPPPGAAQDAKFRQGLKKFRSDPRWLSSDEAEAIGHKQLYVVELDRKSAHMTEHGAKAAQAELGIGTFYDARNMNWPHYIDNALRAHLCYVKDKEYVVQDGAVVIVDEFTGRLMQGRQWSDGLHQAVEAKERVQIKQESQTLATITLQNFFKMYKNLAGMTGTAMTESEEFMKIYKLEVVAIPTNKAIRRIDYNDKIYKNINSKFDAIVEEIRSYSHQGYPGDPWSLYDILRQARKLLVEHKKSGRIDENQFKQTDELIKEALSEFNDGRGDASKLETAYLTLADNQVGGRPLLVGTVSVENSEKLSELLTRRHGIEHEVLNAKNHAREAEIVAKAGQQHEEIRNRKKINAGNVTIATNMAGRGTDIRLGPGVADIGGLHVVGTDRHESRRIDNQLRGRCGRQGDPGSTRFFLSFEDDLIRLFMAEWLLKILDRWALEEGVPIEHRQLTRGIEKAQKKVEERNFGIRKNLLEYDEVPDQQRREFYRIRQRVLEGRDLSGFIWEMIDETVADAVDRYYDPRYPAQCVSEWTAQHLGQAVDPARLDTTDFETLTNQVRDLAANDLRGHIQRTFGEYIDTDVPPDEWDVRGLLQWIQQYGITLTQRQVRESEPKDLEDQIVSAATAKIEEADLSALQPFVEKDFHKQQLAGWAFEKFGLKIEREELEHTSADDAITLLTDKMRDAYKKREIEYPVSAIIEYALQRAGTNANAFYEIVTRWANAKFRADWTYEHFAGKNPQQVFTELKAVNEDYLTNGKLDQEIDAALQKHEGDALRKWADERFGSSALENGSESDRDVRAQLRARGYEMLRYELTQLERTVVLSTYDAIWKDHMYAMDLLRGSIGLHGYAEKDPKIEYKRAGTRQFNEMLSNARERVTDLIFKVQISSAAALAGFEEEGPTRDEGGAFAGMQTQHADATNAGFAGAEQASDREAAMRKQGEAGKPQPIRRETPKVGRNEPCPCGSGKKFKHCHGKPH